MSTTKIVAEAVLAAPDYVLLETEEEVEAASRAKQDERLAALGLSLQKKRTDAINAREGSGVEGRWLEDLAAYHGEEGWFVRPGDDDTADSKRSKNKGKKRRSRQYVQKTRQKTNAGSARLSDMLLPTDDRNWEYEPTPVPELVELLKQGQDQVYVDQQSGAPLPHPEQPPRVEPTEDNPNPTQPPVRMLTNADMAAETIRMARERAMRMQKEVDDQLTECQFNAACRRAVDSAAQLGTGVIRGPVPMNRVKKKWKRKKDEQGKTYYDLEVIEDTRPYTTFVSVWDAYPAPGCGENIHDGGYFWHREVMSPSQLKDLARLAMREEDGQDTSGYIRDTLLECLKEEPGRTAGASSIPDGLRSGDDMLHDRSNYEVWNYWGDASPEDLEALGIDMDDASSDDLRLQSVSVVVSICNDKIIRAVLNPQMKGDIPFDVFQWEKVAGSPWGVGVPFLMRYAQKAMNASWRQMQDNAGVSHGPQVLINRSLVDPANGEWELHGMKEWYLKDDVDPTRAFAMIHVPSNQVDLQAIFMLASQLADEETSLPQLLQGEADSGKTLGEAVLRNNNANVVLKRFARNWDDQITTPHLRRYYDWNMAYNPNEEVKGDFTVKARGSTHLVVRDIRMQELAMITQMRQDPDFKKWINPEKWAKRYLEATSVGDIMFTDAEVMENDKRAAQQQPPQDPRVQAAMIKAETEKLVAQTEAQSEAQNLQLKADEAGRNDERELAKMHVEVQMLYLKYAMERGMQLNEIKAQMAELVFNNMSKQQMDRESRADTRAAQQQMGEFPARRKPKQRQPAAVQ